MACSSWQGDASGLEDAAYLPGDVCPCGDGLAILLDGHLLKAVEIIEQRLPLGLEAVYLACSNPLLNLG